MKSKGGDKIWLVTFDGKYTKGDNNRVYYNEESLLRGIVQFDDVIVKEYSITETTSGISGKEYIESRGLSKKRDEKLESLLNDEKYESDDDVDIVYNYIEKTDSHLVVNFKAFKYDRNIFIKELKKPKVQRFVKYNVSESLEYYISLIRLIGLRSKFEFNFITEKREQNIKKAIEIIKNET
jgi:hypothetical protein